MLVLEAKSMAKLVQHDRLPVCWQAEIESVQIQGSLVRVANRRRHRI
jgi:hypothetical protein